MKMKWIYKLTAVISSAALVAVSCTGLGGNADDGMIIESTVLIYMAADNNLGSYALDDIDEIMDGDVPYYFNEGSGKVLLVYADIRGETPKLIRISKDAYGTVNQEVLMEYEPQNSISDSVMRSVLSYAADLFPSGKNGLVLWSHGTGWLPSGYYSDPYSAEGKIAPMSVTEDPHAAFVKSFGQDSEADEEMDIKDLAAALPIRYSYILTDACLMGGVEVAYELRDCCDYFIASAAEVLAGGFPYDEVTGYLMDGGTVALQEACRLFYEHYKTSGATIAIVNTEGLGRLAEVSRGIFLSTRPTQTSVDRDSLQVYFRGNRPWFYDLEDYVRQLDPPGEMLAGFTNALEQAVVYRISTDNFVIGNTNYFPIKTFSGLSTYVPNPENSVLNKYYRTLAWNEAVMMVE